MKSTPEMRAQARELAIPPRDDYDHAVLAILDDFDVLEKAYDSAVAGRQTFRTALRLERIFAAELVEALQDMVRVWELLELRKNPGWDHKADPGSVIDCARAAIAAAKGRQEWPD